MFLLIQSGWRPAFWRVRSVSWLVLESYIPSRRSAGVPLVRELSHNLGDVCENSSVQSMGPSLGGLQSNGPIGIWYPIGDGYIRLPIRGPC